MEVYRRNGEKAKKVSEDNSKTGPGDLGGKGSCYVCMASSQDFGTLVTTMSSSKTSKDKPDFAAKYNITEKWSIFGSAFLSDFKEKPLLRTNPSSNPEIVFFLDRTVF
jgi:hypothetical protein